jgi:hypothetical protein
MILYRLIDIFFVVFHSLLILLNLTGWIWKKTRLLNLIVLLLTGASWLILGLIVGTIGYCPLTEWHFKILYRLGEKDLPASYIKYLADRLTGLDISTSFVDSITLWAFIGALVISGSMNIMDFLKRRGNGTSLYP